MGLEFVFLSNMAVKHDMTWAYCLAMETLANLSAIMNWEGTVVKVSMQCGSVNMVCYIKKDSTYVASTSDGRSVM